MKKGRFLILIFTLLLLISSCTSQNELSITESERAWLRQQDTIDILFGYEAPPNAYHDEEGEYVGLLVDYLHEIESILDYRFNFKAFDTWDELINYAKVSDDFIVVGIAATEEREIYLDFSDSFISIPYVVVSKKAEEPVTMGNIEKYHVCTVENYAINDYLDALYPDLKVTEVPDNLNGLREVSAGNYDAMILNQMYATYLFDHQGITNLQISSDSGYLNRLHIGTAQGNPDLLVLINKALDQISNERHREIYDFWVYTDKRQISRRILLYLSLLITCILITLLMMWIWNRSLKHKVHTASVEIEKQQSRFRTYIEHAPSGIIAFDGEGQIFDANPSMTRLSNFTFDELLQKKITDFCRSTGNFEFEDLITKLKESGAAECECSMLQKHETTIICIIEAVKLRDDHYLAFMNDVTDKKAAEKEQARIQKLESVSLLAGGIAHDFNNLLTGVYGNIEMAQNHLDEGQKAFHYLTSALESMVDATNLTKQLLTFSKGGDPVKELLQVDSLIVKTARFSLRGSSIRLEEVIPADLWCIHGDKGQLNQVISNIVINAKQAMPQGGTLSITAANKTRYKKKYVKITFKDQGIGITQEYIDKIFDPYFTTKQTGSGLGLASAHSIITKHGGTITVSSKPAKGSTFTILLPATEERPEKPEEKQAGKRKRTQHLHILVMDDEQAIRHIIKTMLMHLGHTVITTIRGEDALKSYRQAKDNHPFDLVICDLTVPGGMGGKLLVKELHEIDPDLPVVVTSGYSTDPILANYQSYGFIDRLAKPFKLRELREMLNRLGG